MSKRISILEDDDGIREVIELLLSEEDYVVNGFASIAAFKNAQGEVPDLFLLDVRLPDGDGTTVCAALKAAQRTKHIPVLMMSAHAAEEEISGACPAQGFVAKPFDIYELLTKVNTALNTLPA